METPYTTSVQKLFKYYIGEGWVDIYITFFKFYFHQTRVQLVSHMLYLCLTIIKFCFLIDCVNFRMIFNIGFLDFQLVKRKAFSIGQQIWNFSHSITYITIFRSKKRRWSSKLFCNIKWSVTENVSKRPYLGGSNRN